MNSAAEKKILEKAVAALAQETGLQFGHQTHFNKRGVEDGYKFELSTPKEKSPCEFRAEVRKNLNNAVIAQLALEAERAN